MTFVRFMIGGAVVAGVPLLANHFGPRVAALWMMVPAMTLISLISVGTSSGGHAAGRVALAALPALLTIAALLLTVAIAVKANLPLPVALTGGFLAWLAAAAALLLLP